MLAWIIIICLITTPIWLWAFWLLFLKKANDKTKKDNNTSKWSETLFATTAGDDP